MPRGAKGDSLSGSLFGCTAAVCAVGCTCAALFSQMDCLTLVSASNERYLYETVRRDAAAEMQWCTTEFSAIRSISTAPEGSGLVHQIVRSSWSSENKKHLDM